MLSYSTTAKEIIVNFSCVISNKNGIFVHNPNSNHSCKEGARKKYVPVFIILKAVFAMLWFAFGSAIEITQH